MRRFILCITPVVLLVSGCAVLDDRSANDSSNLDSDVRVCTPAEESHSALQMIRQPIVPPRMYGGLDIAGGNGWKGLNLHDAVATLCNGSRTDLDDGTTEVSWGPAEGRQLTATFDANKQLELVTVNRGYQGKIAFHTAPGSRFGVHAYEIKVGETILRDGQPFQLAWRTPALADQVTELYSAMMATFAPEMPRDETNCKAAGVCVASTSDIEGYFGVRPIGFYLSFSAVDKAPNAPDYFYAFPLRMLPYFAADLQLTLVGKNGSTATAAHLGDRDRTCRLGNGVSFEDYLANCITVMNDADANAALKQKALAGLSFTTNGKNAFWKLEADGTRPSFSSHDPTSLGSASVDGLVLGVRSVGKVLNDYSSDGSQRTLAGTSAVYREYARLVQEDLHATFPIGSPQCMTTTPAAGCTGLEQLILPTAENFMYLGTTTVLKPGTPWISFCTSADLDACSFLDNDPASSFGPVLSTSRAQIVKVLGHGDANAVPAAVRDPDYFVRFWTKAIVNTLSNGPQDGDITIEPVQGDIVRAKWQNRFELVVLREATNVQEMVLR